MLVLRAAAAEPLLRLRPMEPRPRLPMLPPLRLLATEVPAFFCPAVMHPLLGARLELIDPDISAVLLLYNYYIRDEIAYVLFESCRNC